MGNDEKEIPTNVIAQGADAILAFAAAPMRCGGCGAKVGATTVSRVLEAVRLRTQRYNSNHTNRLESLEQNSSQHSTSSNGLISILSGFNSSNTKNNHVQNFFE